MKMNDLELPDVDALVRFGRLGMAMAASRMLSLIALGGVIALSGYVVYSPSPYGAAVVAIVALCVFVPALKAETKARSEDAPPQA